MKTARYLAALTGSAVLAVSGLTAVTATSAVASTTKCQKTTVKQTSFGKVRYRHCWNGSMTYILDGAVIDRTPNDDCYPRAGIGITYKSGKRIVYTFTPSDNDFEIKKRNVSKISATLANRC